jgi:hypothetical protein
MIEKAVTIGGITFERGVFKGGVAYSHTDEAGRGWNALRPAINRNRPGVGTDKSWWAAQVFYGADGIRSLNSCIVQLEGPDLVDPLYHETDSGLTDPPVRLLAGMARLIKLAQKRGLGIALARKSAGKDQPNREMCRVVAAYGRVAHLIDFDDWWHDKGTVLCGQRSKHGWIRVDVPMNSEGPADKPTCPRCAVASDR